MPGYFISKAGKQLHEERDSESRSFIIIITGSLIMLLWFLKLKLLKYRSGLNVDLGLGVIFIPGTDHLKPSPDKPSLLLTLGEHRS